MAEKRSVKGGCRPPLIFRGRLLEVAVEALEVGELAASAAGLAYSPGAACTG